MAEQLEIRNPDEKQISFNFVLLQFDSNIIWSIINFYSNEFSSTNCVLFQVDSNISQSRINFYSTELSLTFTNKIIFRYRSTIVRSSHSLKCNYWTDFQLYYSSIQFSSLLVNQLKSLLITNDIVEKLLRSLSIKFVFYFLCQLFRILFGFS